MSTNLFCIPKLFCINHYLALLIFMGTLFFLFKLSKDKTSLIQQYAKLLNQKKQTVGDDTRPLVNRPQDQTKHLYRKRYDILEEPTKEYRSSTNLNRPVSYQVVGFVYRDESNPDYNPEEDNRLFLYGRPNYQQNDRFEYYVESGGIKIPLDNTREIYTGDTISVKGYNGTFTAEIYEVEDRYIYSADIY
jgi:hypothetical protein